MDLGKMGGGAGTGKNGRKGGYSLDALYERIDFQLKKEKEKDRIVSNRRNLRQKSMK